VRVFDSLKVGSLLSPLFALLPSLKLAVLVACCTLVAVTLLRFTEMRLRQAVLKVPDHVGGYNPARQHPAPFIHISRLRVFTKCLRIFSKLTATVNIYIDFEMSSILCQNLSASEILVHSSYFFFILLFPRFRFILDILVMNRGVESVMVEYAGRVTVCSMLAYVACSLMYHARLCSMLYYVGCSWLTAQTHLIYNHLIYLPSSCDARVISSQVM
jgi:hypothetical protein